MLTLITGVPGSSKTLYGMHILREAVKAGRPAYSDIDGCTLPGVQPAPDDWRDCPDGSVVVYDEVHRRFPATGKPGRSSDDRVRDFDTHRHRGFDIYLITQWPTKLDHEARTNCGEHVHMIRLSGAQAATRLRWPSVQSSPNDPQVRSTADSDTWVFPKDLFQYYDSATIHTHKFRLPRKVLLPLIVAVIALLAVVWRLASGDSVLAQAIDTEQQPQAREQRSAPAAAAAPLDPRSPDGWLYAQSLPPAFGCIASERACRCFDERGRPLALDDMACRDAVERTLPVRLGGSRSDRSG